MPHPSSLIVMKDLSPCQCLVTHTFFAFADIELSIISATAVSILYPIALNVSIIEAAHGIAFAVLRLS